VVGSEGFACEGHTDERVQYERLPEYARLAMEIRRDAEGSW
jgi:hypothetical protein